MATGGFRSRRQSMRYSKRIDAPLPFVFRWCTDYRDDDDALTDDLYHYQARIVLREPHRIVRVITVPGPDQNRCTDVEIIRLSPPDRWTLEKLSWTDDELGTYRLHRVDSGRTQLEMRFVKTWKTSRIPSRERYRRLFHRVWDRYVSLIEADAERTRTAKERRAARATPSRRPALNDRR
ncbi:MAG: hypothetical protein L3K19_01020 [Thermoplasmata archaeon]|nr:hypothetical protein [Thermoplasmata archaeon]